MSNSIGKPCILCCAITGSLPRKSDNPAVPISVTEQIESSHAVFGAGAIIVHAHVRLYKTTLAPSNAARIARAAELRAKCQHPVVSPIEAPAIRCLRSA